jgi:hypothetical protein
MAGLRSVPVLAGLVIDRLVRAAGPHYARTVCDRTMFGWRWNALLVVSRALILSVDSEA